MVKINLLLGVIRHPQTGRRSELVPDSRDKGEWSEYDPTVSKYETGLIRVDMWDVETPVNV